MQKAAKEQSLATYVGKGVLTVRSSFTYLDVAVCLQSRWQAGL